MIFRQLGGFAQGDDGGYILGTSPAPFFLMAANHIRGKPGAPANIEHTDPFGGMKFVAGKRQHVHAGITDIDRKLAGGLHGIGVKQNAPVLDLPGNFFHRKYDAGFIIGPHQADDGSIVVEAFV